ncbi:MAG: caspase family protein [Bacteroidetes bacterium]|nr:caspase family protein [Bacteroidota bacterium]
MAQSCSLHIGINRTQHAIATKSTRGVLRFCHSDAWTMAEIARDRGYESITVLLDAAATFDRVVQEVLKARDLVRGGGTFLWTFSGHGTIAPAFGREEKFDQGWVLADGILIDNCVHDLLADFDSAAVIDLVSDCCYSGDMARFLDDYADEFHREIRAFTPDELPREKQLSWSHFIAGNAGGAVNRLRECPIQGTEPRDITAAVICIGSCRETEIAADGAFTPMLKEQLEAAQKSLTPTLAGYDDLIDRIARRLPASQNPVCKTCGRRDASLMQRPPFSIPAPSTAQP